MKNKKLIFAVLFAGVLALNTLVLSTTNNNDIQLNSLFTLASAQAEDGEDGEHGYSVCHEIIEDEDRDEYLCPEGDKTYGIVKRYYGCNGGVIGGCNVGKWEYWWDCVDKTQENDMRTFRNCPL